MCASGLQITIAAPPINNAGDGTDSTETYERTLAVPPALASDHNKLALYLTQTNMRAPVLAAITGDASTLLRIHLAFLTGGDAPPVRVTGSLQSRRVHATASTACTTTIGMPSTTRCYRPSSPR